MAYTTGWAQRRVQNVTAQLAALNALLGTGTSPVTTGLASTKAFEVTAGVSVSIRWGYSDPNNILTSSTGTNTVVGTLNLYYETQSINLWETAATDTFTIVGGATSKDQILTFTPTHTGTLRIFASLLVKVTASGTTVNLINTDGGNQFSGGAETLAAGVSSTDSTYGLIRSGTTLNSLSFIGIRTGNLAFYPDSIQDSFVTGNAPNFADGTYTVLWQSPSGTTFLTQTIAAGTSTTITDTSKQVNPLNAFPASSSLITEVLTPANSSLSTANGGIGLPWIHFTSAPSSPGTVTTSLDTAGNIVAVTFTGVWTADPRVQIHCHTQKVIPITKDNPNTPSFTDINFFIISADVFKGWAHVANNASPPENQAGFTFNMHLADPTNTSPTTSSASQGTGDNVFALNNTGSDGWVADNNSNRISFTPIPPAGQWHYYAANVTDGISTWSGLYIIRRDDNTDAVGNFAGFKGVSFVSAYRDNLILSVAVKTPTEGKVPKPGDVTTVTVAVFKTSGSMNSTPNAYHFDQGTIPTLKITRWNSVTNQLEYWTPIGTPPVTVDPGTVSFTTGYIIDGSSLSGVYKFIWTIPTSASNAMYMLTVGASVDGGDKYFVLPIIISSDPTNPVFDGVDFATGFPFR